MKYQVTVYEPEIDPGGYNAEFTVYADDIEVAKKFAPREAQILWPDSHRLEVASVNFED